MIWLLRWLLLGRAPCAMSGVHAFEARYDVRPDDRGIQVSGMGRALQRTLDAMQARTYVCDVCVRCGKRVERA